VLATADLTDSADITWAEVASIITGTVVDDSHNHVITNIDTFTEAAFETQASGLNFIISTEIDTKSELEAIVTDVADFAMADGDTYTSRHDYGAAVVEIPHSATPTVDENGEMSLDTSVTDWSHSLLKFYGGEEQAVLSMPIAQFSGMTDGAVPQYVASSDEFQLTGTLYSITSPDSTLNINVNGTDLELQVEDLFIRNDGNDTTTGDIAVAGGEVVLGSITQDGTLVIYDDDVGGDATITIQAPDALGTSYTYTLPPDDGDAGEQLQTDGSGVLTWEAAGAGGSGAYSDATPVILNTTTKDVIIAGPTQVNTSKATIDGDADQVQLSIQGNATQTSDLVVLENSAGTELIDIDGTGVANFKAVGTGANGAYDATFGASGTYGGIQIGSVGIYDSSFSASGLDLDRAVLFRQEAALGVGNNPGIEFAWMEGGNTIRLAIPESGSGNATAMIRSVTIAGPYSAVTGNNIVLGDTWTTYNSNLDFDTGATGADLFVQDDFEVEGEIFIHGSIFGDADDANQHQITFANATADRVFTFPDDQIHIIM
jgi:hypothetical protein